MYSKRKRTEVAGEWATDSTVRHVPIDLALDSTAWAQREHGARVLNAVFALWKDIEVGGLKRPSERGSNGVRMLWDTCIAA